MKLTGKTVARINPYVGEQLANTGPSAAPIARSPAQPCFSPAFSNSLSELPLRFSFKEILFQILGNKVISPKKITIPPLIYFQTIGSILIKAVETFNNKVKITIDEANARVIRSGFSLELPETELPMMIGKSGNTQGARTVNIPEIYEVKSSENIIGEFGFA